MYYVPKEDTFILENTYHDYVHLIGFHSFAPGERKVCRRGEVKLYQDDYDEFGEPFVYVACWPIAVEVDGKRYEHVDDDREDSDGPHRPRITLIVPRHERSVTMLQIGESTDANREQSVDQEPEGDEAV